jgi:hypothetical protein
MRIEPLRYSRRTLIEMMFGTAAAAGLLATGNGCGQVNKLLSGALPANGELLSTNHRTGHRLRDVPASLPKQIPNSEPQPTARHRCVIVGAGVAGLSAAWHLLPATDDVLVLELETTPGGTSQSGSHGEFYFPWGAHYLPVPQADNEPLVKFLMQCGVLELGGTPPAIQPAEQYLCRDPEERVFAAGQWHDGLFPETLATVDDRQQLDRYRDEMLRLSQKRDDEGRRLFALPTKLSSTGPEARQLDSISMSQWMDEHGFDSPLLRWLVDYACRDDYGLHTEQTSAWAGLFYFAARMAGDHDESQSVLTWPEGNGFLVNKLIEPLGQRLRLGHAVMRITPRDLADKHSTFLLDVLDTANDTWSTIEAEHVIVAVPQFIASRILDRQWLDALETQRLLPHDVFTYGSWIVANVHLSDRPAEAGFPMSWDNVAMSSGSLGYVNATHQMGLDHGATVLTWYQALPDDAPPIVRERLMNLTWAEAAETVIMDLEITHPDIRPLITRLDVMRWGHAMPQPRVGAIFHPARIAARQSIGNVHFACTDLSGIALFEEAFEYGRDVASQVHSVVR